MFDSLYLKLDHGYVAQWTRNRFELQQWSEFLIDVDLRRLRPPPADSDVNWRRRKCDATGWCPQQKMFRACTSCVEVPKEIRPLAQIVILRLCEQKSKNSVAPFVTSYSQYMSLVWEAPKSHEVVARESLSQSESAYARPASSNLPFWNSQVTFLQDQVNLKPGHQRITVKNQGETCLMLWL